jgi:hypothetical protein
MSSAITCVKSELEDLPHRRSSPSSVLPCRKRVRRFFTAEIWSASSPCTLVSFESQKMDDCSLLHVALFLHGRLPKGKHRIMSRRSDRYSWIWYSWIVDFARNTDMVWLFLHFQQANNSRRCQKLIDGPISEWKSSQYFSLSINLCRVIAFLAVARTVQPGNMDSWAFSLIDCEAYFELTSLSVLGDSLAGFQIWMMNRWLNHFLNHGYSHLTDQDLITLA